MEFIGMTRRTKEEIEINQWLLTIGHDNQIRILIS